MLSLVLAGCAVDEAGLGGAADDELTSVAGQAFTIDFDSFVDVPAGASDDEVKGAMHRQLKSGLGALREQGIGVADRDAQRNLAGAVLVRTPLDVVDASGAVVRTIDRVRFHYSDTALVEKHRIPGGPVDLTLLFGDYVARAAELTPPCSDDAGAAADSLWYHFSPRRSACRTKIKQEATAIAAGNLGLDTTKRIRVADAERRFVSVRATLTAQTPAPPTFPEYDRLWGFAGDQAREKLVVYAFFGVDADLASPTDSGLVEYLRFQRTLRARFPGLRVVETRPHAWLLDFFVDGQRVEGVTFSDVERWVVDGAGFPAVVGSDAAKRAALLAQVVERFAERWIVWQLPVTVTRGGETRAMTVEIRGFYGWEDGTWERRLHARWRYLEAFWHADVFAYTGHSHFGHGPLEPWTYAPGNFPARYQTMLVNSCLSFNYYDEDFLAMHPGGSKDLDVVVNGLAAYWRGMGQATASYVIGLVDGEDKTWAEVLAGMAVNLPWQTGYDPMRAVNGELDNQFDPATGGEITVTPR